MFLLHKILAGKSMYEILCLSVQVFLKGTEGTESSILFISTHDDIEKRLDKGHEIGFVKELDKVLTKDLTSELKKGFDNGHVKI